MFANGAIQTSIHHIKNDIAPMSVGDRCQEAVSTLQTIRVQKKQPHVRSALVSLITILLKKKGLYCSTCVETENWRNTPDLSGEHNGKWNGGKLKLECETCGVPVHRYPSNVGEHGFFCGTECRSAWLSEHYTGENHPHWRGGSSGTNAYGPGWAKMRRRALERDAYTCQHCGTTKEELGRNPDVHHIIPVRAFVEMPVMMVEDAHYLENLVSLCIPCHRKAEFGKISQEELETACV